MDNDNIRYIITELQKCINKYLDKKGQNKKYA